MIEEQDMATLLVQACSKSKNHPPASTSALDLYTGYFFSIIKKAMREGEFDSSIDVCILSAEHGLIDATDDIEWYDRKMDRDRARDLAPQVRKSLQNRAAGDYDRIVVNVGEMYRRALDGIESEIDTQVHYIEGKGIGEKGHALKRVVRGDGDRLSSNRLAKSTHH